MRTYMGKWMGLMGLSLAILGVTPLSADFYHPQRGLSSSRLLGCWEVGAAALWQQTCGQNFNVADAVSIDLSSPDVSVLEHHVLQDLKPDFYWGFEVWVGWNSGCLQPCALNFARVTYKRLHSYRDGKQFGNFDGFNVVNVNHLGPFDPAGLVISAGQYTALDTAHARLGRTLIAGCDSTFYAYIAGRYVGAELNRMVLVGNAISPSVSFTLEATRFRGGGIDVGFGGEYPLFCGFGAAASIGGIALFGNREDQFVLAVTDTFAQSFSKREFTKCVPGVDLRAGLHYTYRFNVCGYCAALRGEAGWQMDYFWNILGVRGTEYLTSLPLLTGGSNFQDPLPTNFGTSGLYLALSVFF